MQSFLPIDDGNRPLGS